MKTIRTFCTLYALLIVLAIPTYTHAVANCTNTGFCTLVPDSLQSPKLSSIYTSADTSNPLSTYISRLFALSLSVGAMLAVLRLSWAGYEYMVTDAWGEKGRAKRIIGDTLLGLVLLLSIYLILYQINPDLLRIGLASTTRSPTPATQNSLQYAPPTTFTPTNITSNPDGTCYYYDPNGVPVTVNCP